MNQTESKRARTFTVEHKTQHESNQIQTQFQSLLILIDIGADSKLNSACAGCFFEKNTYQEGPAKKIVCTRKRFIRAFEGAL